MSKLYHLIRYGHWRKFTVPYNPDKPIKVACKLCGPEESK